jgi:hypothetical protein
MQGIYNYIPETNRVYRVYTVAAVLCLQFALHIMLFSPMQYVLSFYISTFRSMCAVHNMAAFFFLQFLNFVLSWNYYYHHT